MLNVILNPCLTTTLNWNLCNEGKPQTDSHLLDCTKIIQNCPDLANNYSVEYEDIFSDSESQLMITKIFKQIFDIKFKLDGQMSECFSDN